MGCHCDERDEYGLKREKAEVAAGKMMQYGSPMCPALVSAHFPAILITAKKKCVFRMRERENVQKRNIDETF